MTDNLESNKQSQQRGQTETNHSKARHGWLIVLIVLIVVVCVVIAGIVPRMKAKAALRTETNDLAVPTVNAIHPKEGSPQSEIVVPGNIQAFMDSPIYSRTNGYLKKWNVDIGAHVKMGQLLAEIETPEVDQQFDQATADLNTARANYRLSEITAARYQDLLKTDSVSKQDVDNATGDFEAKKAMVASSESNLKRLQELQSFEKIYAPFDGVITARNTDVGHLINSGAGAPATELFHMASLNPLRVYINVPQQYSQAAKPGLMADLTLQEFPSRRFKGKLVRTADSIDVATRTLLVEVDVDNPTGELLPGAYTEVHLAVPASPPSVILPVSALIFRTAGLQAGVVENRNKAHLKDIVLGRDFGISVEVVSGLTTKDLVIVNPPDSLVSGETVRVVNSGDTSGGTPGDAASKAE